MLTVREFNEAVKRHLAWMARWFAFPMLLLIIGLGVALHWFVDPVPWLRTHVHHNFPAALVDPLAVIAVVFPICLLAVWPIHAFARRDSRLVCPHCDRGLYRPHRRVIATRKCPRCGSEILTDPDRRRRPRLTREEVEAGAARCRRSAFVIILGFPLAVSLGVGLGFGAEYLKDRGLVSGTFALCGAVLGVLVVLGESVWAIIRAIRLLESFVRCPRCGERNEFVTVKKFGGCCHCSQPLIRRECAVGAAGGPPGG